MAGEQYQALFEEAGRKHNVDPALLSVIAHQESRYNPDAVSPQGAEGLMQIMPKTAKGLKVNPKDPAEAVDGAARLLAEALDRNNGNLEDAIGEYHGGPNRKIWGPKNRAYRSEVMAKYSGAAPVDSSVAGAPDADSILFGDAPKEAKAEAPAGPADDILFGDTAPKAEMTGFTPFREVQGQKVPGFLSKEQEPLFAALNKGGGYKPNDPAGSPYNPLFAQTEASEKDVPAGSYYVTRTGEFKRAPGGEENSFTEKLTRGATRGAGDVALSVANLFPGGEDSTIRNRLFTNQKVYDADLKGDTVAGATRFLGQVGASLPVMAGVEAAAAPALMQGAAGRFLLGEAGTKMAPSAARILTRGGSLAANGAVLGSEAAALTSSASDEPLSDQMKAGAIVGGVLGPLAPAIMSAGRKAGAGVADMANRWTYGGREKAVDKLLGDVAPGGVNLDTRELVPGSFPTMAEAAGEAGISALERNARTNPKLAQVFSDRMDQNANARKQFFEKVAKDPEAITDAEAARETATAKLRDDAFKTATAADPAPVLAKIDQILKSPSGQRSVVVKALNEIRPKLDGQTDVQQLYGIRKAIGDMLDPLGPAETKGATLAKAELMDVKRELNRAIEKAAPGFGAYLKTFSDMSKPIDEMKLLQSLRLTDQQGNITLAKLNNAIDRIETKRKAGGTSKEKSVSKDTLDALKALQADLKRADNIMKGKAKGSDTEQNRVINKFAEGGGIPLAVGTALSAKVPFAGMAVNAANKAVAGQNDKMLQQFSSRLLNPTPVTPITVKPVKTPGPVTKIALPAVGGITVSRLLGQ